ncbi:MAG: ATP-dependent DNA ligase [Actinobacteria bacterium]|nr:ATP-dependent DNA ligase [Actinomycetota bacterium]MBU1494654.1 ATP-dependent DNA ligase [Actinomycetota bacterium]
MAATETHLEAAGRTVRLSSPDKVLFPATGWTKVDVAEHYLMCAEGAVRGVRRRPCSLKRWPGGVTEEFFFTKRAPSTVREAVEVRFPSARPGRMAVVDDVSDILDQVQLGVLDLNPWNSRAGDLDHPDELRLDLDPTEGFSFDDCRTVAEGCRHLLSEVGLVGWPKTSGSRGIHVYARLEPRWSFGEVRRAALAFGREMERRLPGMATTAWWKEERRGVFLDYNQNARDKTVASAYSVRPTGLVSTPFAWAELGSIDPAAMTLDGFRSRWAAVGDLTEGIDEAAGSLEPLLGMVAADEERGLGDAPWPPHYPKQPGEPPRVQPSKRRMEG